MGKVICYICGTAYQETADACPICGYPRGESLETLIEEDFQLDDLALEEEETLWTAGSLHAEESGPVEDVELREDDCEEPRRSPVLVVVLVVLITLLLAVSGYLFLRYFLPNMQETVSTTTQTLPVLSTETIAPSTTELRIPCEGLVLTGGVDPIVMEGGYRLLHVRVTPADTTDELRFVSENEAVVIVNDDGRMTATGEGETYVTITCGQQHLRCFVVVDYSLIEAETTEPETIPPMTTSATEAEVETEQTETEGLRDVVLKLKQTDFILEVGRYHTIPLDCDLSYEDIQWSVENPDICKVENGKVTALRKGVTDVIAQYGDQVVTCRVRCQ